MVTVIGLGFVGLTTALGFAELGMTSFGYDIDDSRVDRLKQLIVDSSEPHIRERLSRHLNHGFCLTKDLKSAVQKSNCIMICVGTPCMNDGGVDLNQIIHAVTKCLEAIPDDRMHRTIAIKSTVPPGTCQKVIEPLVRSMGFSDEQVSVACNPEFLREGFCWHDFIHPGRIVIGSKSDKAIKTLEGLYEKIDAPVFFVSCATAEFSKYLSNIMLATLISFSNEMAYSARFFDDVDVCAAFDTLHQDLRIHKTGIASYFYPGCGYGGYCLPKDIQAFSVALEESGYDSNLLKDVMIINNRCVGILCDQICNMVGKSAKIGILGLSFKPDSSDVRESSAMHLIRRLNKCGYNFISAYDPQANETFKQSYPDLCIDYYMNGQELVDESDMIVITTAWHEFKHLKYSNKPIIDGRYYLRGK